MEGDGMKKLVVSALAYYGLKVFHVFDGREFRACLKLIQIDREKALEEFREIVNASGEEIVESFGREFCRPTDMSDSTSVIPGIQIQPLCVPQPIMKLLPKEITEQGNCFTKLPPIWTMLSTFNKDNSGHYVPPYHEKRPAEADAEAERERRRENHAPALLPRRNSPVEDEETCLRNLEQYICPPAFEGPSRPYSPTKDFSPNRNLAHGRQSGPEHKPLAPHHIESIEEFYEWIEHPNGPTDRNDGVPAKHAAQPPCIPNVEEVVSARQDIPKVCSVEVVAPVEVQKEQAVSWREELAKTRPDLYYELLEDLDTNTDHEGPNEEMVSRAVARLTEPLVELPPLTDVEMEDVEHIEEESYFPTVYGAVHEHGPWVNKVGRTRKRVRGTDEEVSGRTVLNDSSSSGSIERGKVRMKPRIPLQGPNRTTPSAVNGISEHSEEEIPIYAGGSEEEKVVSEACSCNPNLNGADQNADECESEPPQKRNRTSWPAPLYGNNGHRTADQTHAKSSLSNLVTEDGGENCEHEVRGKSFEQCSKCNQKEEIAFSKYTRLFKDDAAWKQKFLDGEKLSGEKLTCDICSSKGKNQIFRNVTLLLSHARKGTDLRRPEHQGYAKAIVNLMQLNQPGSLESCHSSVGTGPSLKRKRVWPPVLVLENTYKAGDQCSDFRNLEIEVTNRLRGFVNIETHTVHKILDKRGYFKGQILVEFPPTRRGLIDARRLHQHFLLTGRSLRDWQVVAPTYEGLLNYQPGGQEHYGLAKVGPRGEILARVYFGYLATLKIMQMIDAHRRCVRWHVGEANFDEDED